MCHVCTGTHGGQKRVSDFFVAKVTGGCEAPEVSVRNRTWVLWESSRCS